MAIDRTTGGAEPLRPESAGRHELRRTRSTRMATGTLACPGCDVPVAPGPGALSPRDAMRCPVCGQAGSVRDFLSLEQPSRPARVQVRVIVPARPSPVR